MENVNIKINGKDYSVPAGSTILEAAHYAGVVIPTLLLAKVILTPLIHFIILLSNIKNMGIWRNILSSANVLWSLIHRF